MDAAGKPIRGVPIRVCGIAHDTNGGIFDPGCSQDASLLGSAVTDESGRYTLSLPDKAKIDLVALHPRYVGPGIECRPDDRTIAPVTLEDAGGIAGTVVDAATGRPVGGARLGANRIEHDEHNRNLIGSGWAISDALGRFRIEALAPGVYNLCLRSSPRGERFTAQAVEGVRIRAGENAPADLKLVAGRRVHGRVVDATTGKLMSGVFVSCISSSWPGSGGAGQSVHTDDQGSFECFVPPGLAYVYLSNSSPYVDGSHLRALNVSADRDPDPVLLKGDTEPGQLSKRVIAHEVRVRVKAELGNEPPRDGPRTLIGRIFDQDGSAIAGVQVTYNDRKSPVTVTGATDRLGVFRLRGLPRDKFLIGLHKLGYSPGSVTIPPEAWEVDLTLPSRPNPPE